MKKVTNLDRVLAFLKKTKRPKSAKQIAAKLDVDVSSLYTMLHKAVEDGLLQEILAENTPYLFQHKKRSSSPSIIWKS